MKIGRDNFPRIAEQAKKRPNRRRTNGSRQPTPFSIPFRQPWPACGQRSTSPAAWITSLKLFNRHTTLSDSRISWKRSTNAPRASLLNDRTRVGRLLCGADRGITDGRTNCHRKGQRAHKTRGDQIARQGERRLANRRKIELPRLIAEQAMVAGLLRLGGFEPGFPFALGHDALVVSSAAKDWQRFLGIVHLVTRRRWPRLVRTLSLASARSSLGGASPGRPPWPKCQLMTGRCRPPAVVQKSTDAEQKRRKRISFLAEIEESDSDQNAYHGHGYNFEHGVRSGAVQRIARGARGRGPLFANAPSANSIASTPSRTVSQPSASIILSLRGRSRLQRSP